MSIIKSLLEPDFYKFTMGQFVWRNYAKVNVTFALKCRTKGVHLGRAIDIGQLREELDHVRSLRFTNSELHYLRGTNEYGERMFCEPWLDLLKGLRLPEYLLEVNEDGDLRLEFAGAWPEVIYWETIALSIVNELYARALMKPLTRFERDVVYATGRMRLAEKIRILRENPEVVFSDFGSRRRFSADWQEYVDETLRDELPDQFLGTSNTYLAMKTGTVPMGTAAHELFMVVAGLREGGENWLVSAQREVLDLWWREYGWGLSIFLPDTFGSDFFVSNLTEADLREWKGFRQDSGDIFAFGDKRIAEYERLGIDPRGKILIPSDGLDLSMMLKIKAHFTGRIKVSDGWGTNLTNDLFDPSWRGNTWYGPLSMVVKAVNANGHHLVKLSDNLAKATGRPEDVERYKAGAGYTNTESVECKY